MGFLAKLGNSKFLKKEDCLPTPLLLTIKMIQEENVSMEDEPDKFKQVVYFQETDKGLVLNKTCGHQIASFLGDPQDPREWYGKQIVLFCDPNVTMKGRMVGGIRVQQPRNVQQSQPAMRRTVQQSVPRQQQAPMPPPTEDDDLSY